MKQVSLVLVIAIFRLLFNISVYAQEGIPVIETYSVENYQAGMENWDAIQSPEGLMYFANSEGLLEYDGVNWQLIKGTIGYQVRSLAKSREGNIYLGGDNILGCLKVNEMGQKEFVSLVPHCPPQYQKYLDHVWKILIYGSNKYILAGGTVIILDQENNFVKILEDQIYLRSLFLIKRRIIAYSNSGGILELDKTDLSFKPIFNKDSILNLSLEFIGEHPQGGLRLHIFNKGFYRLYNGQLTFEKNFPTINIDTDYIFCKGRLNNLLLLGSTVQGLYALDRDNLYFKYHFNKANGLNDEKIFAIYTDKDHNIWLCHENGLSYIEISAPVRIINENLGIRGPGLCISNFDSTFFIGTTNGLFYSHPKPQSDFYDFRLFQQVRQPTYFLEVRGNSMLIGCLQNIFEYKEGKFKKLSDSRKNIKAHPFPSDSTYYLVGNSQGFLCMKYRDGFHLDHSIRGADIDILDFDFDHYENIWIINSKNELIQAKLDLAGDSLIIHHTYNEDSKEKLKFYTVASFDNLMMFGTNQGMWFYDEASKSLKNLELGNTTQNESFTTNWIFNQNNKDLWYEKAFIRNGQLNYQIDILSEYDIHTKANSLNALIYGNKAFSFGKLNDKELGIGTSEGLLLFNPERIDKRKNIAESYIRNITIIDSKDTTSLNGLWFEEGNSVKLKLDEEVTNIEFKCAANYFHSRDKVFYSYKLDGVDNDWKEWTSDNIARYTINGDGKFTFHLKATSNYSSISETTSYSFVIKKPWYKTFWWYCIEIGFLVIVMLVSFFLNRTRNSKLSKVSAFLLILIILTFFETISELLQDWLDAQGVSIFALKIAVNILIAMSLNPIEHWIRKKFIRPVRYLNPQEVLVNND